MQRKKQESKRKNEEKNRESGRQGVAGVRESGGGEGAGQRRLR